jgi:hypothetical protein
VPQNGRLKRCSLCDEGRPTHSVYKVVYVSARVLTAYERWDNCNRILLAALPQDTGDFAQTAAKAIRFFIWSFYAHGKFNGFQEITTKKDSALTVS